MHVLSLPPAFVLSQDQTLRLNQKLSIRLYLVTLKADAHRCASLDRVPTIKTRRSRSSAYSQNVSAGKLLLHRQSPKGPSARHPPPTFLFLQYALVKEPKGKALQNPSSPRKARQQQSQPRKVRFPVSTWKMRTTAQGAGQTPAPPSLWELYTHRPRKPSSPTARKKHKTRKNPANTPDPL